MKLNPKDAKQLVKIRARLKVRKMLNDLDPLNRSHIDAINNYGRRILQLKKKYHLNDENIDSWIYNSLNMGG